ncbi:PilT/PilU family type 4a pilus ATPase [Shewanella sp. Scap07]|uniref:PilT/PilU family type 4a pilus ATPase n=1 Tax=Shewanella sp. Scap07 TaxID=2589987 RepID=UPI0015B80C4A|nr:PilT/PilU family type 4a pilus ATPase [Shewanella sp. Scap07]QLE85364.1 PilT/PilU family type 4a pilus ATPase [Shewanella sp. Scap07]
MGIAKYLKLMVLKQASDLFFSPDAPVLIKIEGQCSPVEQQTILHADDVKSLAYSLMKDRQLAQFESEWDVSIGITLAGVGRFRVSIFRQMADVAMVIRHIKTEPPQLHELNLPPCLADLVMQPRGLILVAGATGSGKSTTLASMIDYRNANQPGHILTIEDPIEFVHSYKQAIINQREVGEDTKSYAQALRSAMREAPDVILIGEIRDQETMKNAISYAETGHLCLATIHASNSIETLDRVINFFPEIAHKQLLIDLSHNLKAVICQRLIPGVDQKRWPAIEILRDTPFIRELIRRAKIDDIRDALERNLEQEVVTFDEAILQLYKQGRIDKQAALNFGDSRHNLEVKIRLLEGKGISDDYQDIEVN